MTGKNILTGVALSALIAGTAVAASLTDNAGEAVEGTTGAIGSTIAQTGDTMGDAVTDSGETAGEAVQDTGDVVANAGEADQAGAEGTVVLSSDDQTIGTVQSVETTTEGSTQVIVAVDDSLELPVQHVKVGAETDANGEYELAMSRDEFVAAVNAQLKAMGNVQSN
ncbi:hypothetical protein [Pseudoruegeria sp. HB172150]|uniref:hypothetical protein n=1 Tax=Pseudoruegeria sp. HB172150 TaxID=2721164 RepID=UPI001C130C06|nr:hypothetical protein [Pseudoruegeria sp. HB172150]